MRCPFCNHFIELFDHVDIELSLDWVEYVYNCSKCNSTFVRKYEYVGQFESDDTPLEDDQS